MKKYFILLLGVIIVTISGCGKGSKSVNVKDNFVNNSSKKDTYLVKGTMDIISNEDTFTYNVVAAKSKDMYRVNLINIINNHEQVILKNSDGVYVVTQESSELFY